jgi:3-oxoacid CoA-transferase
MKNKVFASFDEAIADIFDGAIITHSTFGTASQALNLWEALSRKDIKNLTIIGNMLHPRQNPSAGLHLPAYGPINCVLQPGKVKRIIVGFTSNVYSNMMSNALEYDEVTKDIEVIPVSFGTICLRLEAAASGYGGILSPVGVGTFMEEQCQKITVDGKEYLIEKPIYPDFGFVKAWKADKLGNLVYYHEQRVHNPLVARASKVTIAEVQEIVEPGEIDPDQVHTPHIYVDRIVKIPHGGMGSREWEEVNKVLNFGSGRSQRPEIGAQTDIYITREKEVGTLMADRARLVEKYNTSKLDRQTMGIRIAKEFKDGDYVNLGRGIPTTAADYVDPSVDIYYHAEPGLLGYGTGYTMDEWEQIDPNLHDAAIRHVRPKSGMCVFDMNEAFNMMRGHHLDAGVVGGFQVSEKGDFANWAFKTPVPHSGISIGGGFDLVTGPKRCIVAITHLDHKGRSKVVRELTYPLTGGRNMVDLVITDLAVIEVIGPKGKKEGMVLKEYAPGWTVEEIQALTDARLMIAPDVKAIEL